MAFSKCKNPGKTFKKIWLGRMLKAIEKTTLKDSLEKIELQNCSDILNEDAQAYLEELGKFSYY